MTDVDTSAIDSDARSVARTPFQWDSTINAGFSKSPKTWLPVADNYTIVNVQSQQTAPVSHLKVFQKLMSLRQFPASKYGSLTIKTARDDNLLVYKRELESLPREDIIVVVLNLSDTDNFPQIDLGSILGNLPKQMKIAVSSVDSNRIE